jgi:hypothetical protein
MEMIEIKKSRMFSFAILASAMIIMACFAAPTITYVPSSEQLSSANTRSAISTPGVPAKVFVDLAPPIVLADNGLHYYVVKVELQDLYGNPAYAPDEGTGISLASSNQTVGDVYSKTLTIPGGYTFQYTHFLSTYAPGTTQISAAATGLISGSASMTTWGRKPSKLQLYLAPDKVLSDNQAYYNTVTVQLQDSNGNPAQAPLGGVTVSLSSSNNTVGVVPTYLSISAGGTFGATYFISTLVPGSTVINAVASGFASSSATMTTVAPGASNATKLMLWLAPPKVIALNAYEYNPVVVQLRDSSDRPVKPSATVTISLYSSNTTIGQVNPTISITSPASHTYTWFASTFTPGKTQIIAKSPSLTDSPLMIMYTDGNNLTKVTLYASPTKVFAHKRQASLLFIQTQDSTGNPARVPNGGLVLNFVSSNPAVGTLEGSQVTIGAGSDTGWIWLDSTYVPGSTTIKASSVLPLTSVTVKTVAPAPSKLALDLAQSKVFADQQAHYNIIRVILQDASGNIALAPPGGITVSLSSSNTIIGTVQTSVGISEGSFYATAWFQSTQIQGTVTITATAPIGGIYKTASANMTTIAPTVSPPAKVGVAPLAAYVSIGGATYYNTLFVYLQDTNGNPAYSPQGGIGVSLSSSDGLVCVVPTGLIINQGSTDTYTWLYSKWSPGTATVTPAATDSSLTSISKAVTTGVFTGTPKSYNFGSMTTLFYKNTYLIVGNGTTANETMSAAVLAPALTAAGMLLPTVKTDILLTPTERTTNNLIEFGYNNTIRATYPFGISVSQDANWFNVTATAENLSVNFTKSNYPNKTIAVVYLKQEGSRAIMFIWGYGWQGTYAGALFISSQKTWQTYASKHLLFLQWTDANGNGFVDASEISLIATA